MTTRDEQRPQADIREMEIDDLPSVYHLGERLFTSEEFPILYRTWDPYEVTSAFTSDPDYCYVAEADDGKVVGFILATTIEKEGTAWKKYGYISWIGVDEEFQRVHLASRLYRRVEDRLRADGVRMVLADTSDVNEEALAFFRRMRFNRSGQHIWLAKTLRRKARKASQERSANNG
ncbi:MAG: GNAT family N-acetyltransferase [Chloroflexi bacterium]|nr:GNAT family N-acetyltransferase [Chloroflexota bacterium]